LLPDHISSDQPKNGVIVKIVIELLDTRLTFIFQYVKELIRYKRTSRCAGLEPVDSPNWITSL